MSGQRALAGLALGTAIPGALAGATMLILHCGVLTCGDAQHSTHFLTGAAVWEALDM